MIAEELTEYLIALQIDVQGQTCTGSPLELPHEKTAIRL
jgi:hypothetical protein